MTTIRNLVEDSFLKYQQDCIEELTQLYMLSNNTDYDNAKLLAIKKFDNYLTTMTPIYIQAFAPQANNSDS